MFIEKLNWRYATKKWTRRRSSRRKSLSGFWTPSDLLQHRQGYSRLRVLIVKNPEPSKQNP